MRNYKKERENYHSRPEQMVRNAARKRARRSMEREGKAKAGDGKDVHHKDNNPLNNDKNNLSLVTQHYNRREPRLRKEKDFQEGPLVVANEFTALEIVAQKFQDILRKKDLKTQQKLAKKVGIKLSKRGNKFQIEANAVSMSNPDAKVMIGMMQKYVNTKNPNLKMALMKKINKLQAKLGLKVTEDMGTVTGPHIAGTGDDSSTVLVKKKKKQKKKLQIRFKLKNQKSLKKRIIDNVLAIQQKV